MSRAALSAVFTAPGAVTGLASHSVVPNKQTPVLPRVLGTSSAGTSLVLIFMDTLDRLLGVLTGRVSQNRGGPWG